MKGVQCYELFGGIALKITHFHFHVMYGLLKAYYVCFTYDFRELLLCGLPMVYVCAMQRKCN